MQTENKSHDESFGDTCGITGLNNRLAAPRPRSSGFKSFLNWFKKIENNQKTVDDDSDSSISSSSQEAQDSDSDSSTSSTATVQSFAFLPPNAYKPYGDACQPEKYINPGPYTETYHQLIKERNKRRHLDKNITIRKKYSLYSSGTLNSKTEDTKNGSNGELKSYDTFSLPFIPKHSANDIKATTDVRKTASLSNKGSKTPYHVKGKRKAPPPPVYVGTIKTSRKKRQAPDPPSTKNEGKEVKPVSTSAASIAHPICEVAAKPWYKRQSTETKCKPKEDLKKRGKHEFPEIGFFRCSRIFESKKQCDIVEERVEKRHSCFLPNISELDREAAEILKHKKRLQNNSNDANTSNEKCIRPSSARELINKFNALTNHYSLNNNLQDDFGYKIDLLDMGARKSVDSSKSVEPSATSVLNTDCQNNESSAKINSNKSYRNDVSNATTSQASDQKTEEKCLSLSLSGDKTHHSHNHYDLTTIISSDTSFQTEVFSALPELRLIEAKPSTSHSEADLDEKTRLKEMLKEMKNSLPKRTKPKTTAVDSPAPPAPSVDNVGPKSSEKAVEMKSIFNTHQINSIAEKYKQTKSESEVPDKASNISTNLPEKRYKTRESNKVDSFSQTKCSVQCLETKVGTPSKAATENPKISSGIYSNLTEASSSETDKKSDPNIALVLKQLESAIFEGNDRLAAQLAKDLALLKVKCSVTTSNALSAAQDIIKCIKIYIEDKFSHQGPIPLNVKENMKLIDLKQKVSKELKIPVSIQKWIIRKQLAVDDNKFLKDYNDGDFDEAFFLYVVSVEGNNSTDNEKTLIPQNVPSENITLVAKSPFMGASERKITEPSTSKQGELVINGFALNNVNKKTWICSKCTLINSLLSPICSACGTRNVSSAAKIESIVTQTKENRSNVQENEMANNDHYLQLIHLDNADLVANTERFECCVCLTECESNKGVVLRECLHSFCKECLASVVKYSEEVQVKCPYRDKDYACEGVMQEREIKALVNKNTFEKHLAKSINVAENKTQNAFHCKTPNCRGWCIFEASVNHFLCPICEKNNCLTCQAIHEGKNCKEYQEDINSTDEQSTNEVQRTTRLLDELVARGEAMACPSCQVVLMKKWGCDWVKCSMCKTEICWVTRGARWGPGGKGDVSAGCQCGVNGVKCHPKCNYCH